MTIHNEGGRPPLKPTRLQRQDVRLFKADGWSDERIARRLGLSRTTLLKHFGHELSNGADEERQAALRLLKKAASKLNIGAIREYLKLSGAGSAVERSLGQPDRSEPGPKPGKKELARELALHAHEDSEWGDDLKPIGPLN
jgi:biotin operon repressor